jgi:hypothetical protein
MDERLRALEREYAATNDPNVLGQMLRLRFTISGAPEDARTLFNFLRTRRLPIELSSAMIMTLLEADDESINTLNWVSGLTIFGQSIQQHAEQIQLGFPKIENLETYMHVRQQKDNSDLQVLRQQTIDTSRRWTLVLNTLIERNVRRSYFTKIVERLYRIYDRAIEAIDKLQEERNSYHTEFAEYLRLVEEMGDPLQAGIEWYDNKCIAYTEKTGQKVLLPEDPVVHFSFPDIDEIFAEDCFFPFYEVLDQEYEGVGFLAALSIYDIFNMGLDFGSYREWEEEVRMEELEKYASNLGVTVEDLEEGDDYYDEYRMFNREFEEELLSKRAQERILEAVDEMEDHVRSYIGGEESEPLKEAWSRFGEDHWERGWSDPDMGWLDDEIQSEVSEVVDEDFERWDMKRNMVRVEPITYYEGYRGYRRKPSDTTPWRQLRTKPVCSKTPMIKLDTKAIGWKAAFGIEPLIL